MQQEKDTPIEGDQSIPNDQPIEPKISRLSPSIAKIMWNRSPAHAYQAHRYLGGGSDDESSKAQNTGKILEALVYNQPLDKLFAVLPFDSFRTKKSQDAKALATAERKTPILEKELADYTFAADIIKKQLAEQGIIFEGGEYQKLVEWTCQDTGANCKGYIDYFSSPIIWDLKCVADASPDKVVRSFVDYGWDIARAAYTEGIEALYPDLVGRTRMIFPFAETEPPYLVSLYEASGEMEMLGAEKWYQCKMKWAECLATGVWPGYFSGVSQIIPTPWQLAKIEYEDKEIGK